MHWFCKPDPRRRTHHLHLVPVGSRRFGTRSPSATSCAPIRRRRPEYLALKRRLAAEFEHDRDGYTDAKAGFIAAALS